MPSKSSGARKANNTLRPDVAAIVAELSRYLEARDDQSRKWCDAKCGVYAFYDFDDQPIYVGQTKEQLRVRIRRHMTNQRTDAVAMRVLDPLEVAYVEVWPFWDFQSLSLVRPENRKLVDASLNDAEYTLFERVIERSETHRVLNEKRPAKTQIVTLPPSHKGKIVPDQLWDRLSHLDERISRRALKIAELAQVIRQRDVSVGLRGTLVTQAERLLLLSNRRYLEIVGETPRDQLEAELVGQEDDGDLAQEDAL